MRKEDHFIADHIRKHRLSFAGIIVAGFVNSCVSFLLPVSIGEFFTLHFHSGSSKAKLLDKIGLHLHSIQDFFLLFAFLLTIKTIISYVQALGTYRQGELFVKELRERIFATQMQWDPALVAKGSFGKYLLRYSNDMKAVQNYFMKGVLEGTTNLLFVCTGIVMLCGINLMLTVILFSILVVIATLIYALASYQKPFIDASRTHRSSLLAFVAKSLSGLEKLKQRSRELETIENFERRSENLYQSNMQYNQVESVIQTSISFLIFLTIGIVLWQMTMPYVHIAHADGLMVVLIIMMMQGALRKILKIPGYINKGRISLQKIDKLLQEKVPTITADITPE